MPTRRGRGAATEPQLVPITIYVCAACLRSQGDECHTPGCTYWMRDVPTPEQAELLKLGVLPWRSTDCDDS